MLISFPFKRLCWRCFIFQDCFSCNFFLYSIFVSICGLFRKRWMQLWFCGFVSPSNWNVLVRLPFIFRFPPYVPFQRQQVSVTSWCDDYGGDLIFDKNSIQTNCYIMVKIFNLRSSYPSFSRYFCAFQLLDYLTILKKMGSLFWVVILLSNFVLIFECVTDFPAIKDMV